ncbi:MAG TPA: flippase [Gemmatimonadaceae bacterium]|nr:flippase [Gemmatimonadaceae bacterium]
MTQRIAKNAIWNFSGQVAQSVVALVCIPLLVKYLGLSRVGLLSLIWVMVGYFSILDFGLGQALTKTAAEAIAAGDATKVRRLYSNATRIQLLMGLAGGMMMAASAGYLVTNVLKVPEPLQAEAQLSVILCAVAFPLVLLASSATGMLQAAQRFDIINLVQVPLGIGQFLLPLICVIWSKNLAIIVAALLASRIVALICLSHMARKIVGSNDATIVAPSGELRSLISFGGWVTISNIVSPLMVFADRFLIGALQTVSALTYYSVPSDATLRFLIVPRSLASAMFPVMSATADPARLRDLVLRSVRYILLLVGIPTLLLFFAAHEAMSLWMGESFAARSSLVLQILLPGILANSIAQVPYALIQATGRADITAKLHVAEFPLYAAIAFFAIRTWGVEGAAFIWTLRVMVDTAVLFYVARRRIGISFSDASVHLIPRLLGMLAIGAAASLLLKSLLDEPTGIWIAMICLAAILVSMGWGWFLTESERARMIQILPDRSARGSV